MDMVDYLKWRGDLTFDKDPFNDIDNLLISQMTYIEMQDVFAKHKKMSVMQLSKEYFKDKYSCSSFCFIKPEQTLMSAIDVIKEIEESKEIKKNSLNSFPNEKTNIKFSKKFKDTITAGINYKIIKRFSNNDFNLVLLEVLENSNSGF